jgi:hypothetical protein
MAPESIWPGMFHAFAGTAGADKATDYKQHERVVCAMGVESSRLN